MNRIGVALLVIVCWTQVHAQTENARNWQLGFHGDALVHAGFKLAFETPLKNWTRVKAKKENKTSYRSYNFSPEFIYYKHPNSHHGLAVLPAVNYQRTRSSGGFVELRLAMGYHRSFIDGTTHRVLDSGEVETVPLAGQGTFISAFYWSFGKDLRISNEKPFRYYGQLGINTRAPFNKHLLPGVNLGFGIHYFLGSKSTEQ